MTFAIGFMIPALGFLFPETFFSNQQKISQFVYNFGYLAPIIFIGLSIIPVVITPLNHGAFGIVGGFIFGPWVGFLLNWMSKMIGTYINFTIGRLIGRKATKKYSKSENFKHYNTVFNKQLFLLFAGLTINDTLSYMAGVSTMKTRTFLILTFLAHIIPAMTLAYIGSGVSLKDPLFFILTSIILLIALFYFIIKKNKLNKT